MYEIIARYYDQLHQPLTADINFLQKLAEKTGDPLLELGCGTGRLLFPLAQAGFLVTGIDNSPHMLAIARQKLAAQSPAVQQAVTIVDADLQQLTPEKVGRNYALAILPYNTLLHFTASEIPHLLCGVAGLMQPQGALFIDIANPFLVERSPTSSRPVCETAFVDQSTNQRVEQWSRSSLDQGSQTLSVTWIFRTPAVETEPQIAETIYYYLFPHQVELLLEQAGFRLLKIMGDYAESPFQENSERLLILAELHG